MIGKEESNLLNVLRYEIKNVINFVSKREKILSKVEGEVSVIFPSPLSEKQEYCVKISSYLMDSSGLPQEWSGKTLKIALQRAINGVKFWYQFEEDVEPFSPLSKGLVEDYI